VRSDGSFVAVRHHNRQDGNMRARFLLAAIVLPAFTLSAQQKGSAGPGGATTAPPAGSARRHAAHVQSASTEAKRVDISPASLSGVRVRERRRSAAVVHMVDKDVGAAEDVSLLALGFSAYPMPWGVAKGGYAEPGENLTRAKRAIGKPDAPKGQRLDANPK
jgi:hypothetical protein